MMKQDLSRNEAGTGRALIVTTLASSGSGASRVTGSAAFVTQLLACRAGVPAYRTRRRAEPAAAAQSYRQAQRLIA